MGDTILKYTVYVGGTEVFCHLTKHEAERLAHEYKDYGYTQVRVIEKKRGG